MNHHFRFYIGLTKVDVHALFYIYGTKVTDARQTLQTSMLRP